MKKITNILKTPKQRPQTPAISKIMKGIKTLKLRPQQRVKSKTKPLRFPPGVTFQPPATIEGALYINGELLLIDGEPLIIT